MRLKKTMVSGLLISMLLLTACNEDSTEFYAVVSTVNEAEDPESTKDANAVSLNYTNIINSNTVQGVAIPSTETYFNSSLSESEQRAMEEIILGMVDYREYITLSSSITEEELKKIMDIIMTNVPEIFHSDFAYKYDLNVSGYIKNFFPVYAMDYTDYITVKDTMERNLISYCKNKEITEYDFIYKLYNSISSSCKPMEVSRIEIENKEKNIGYSGYPTQTMAGNYVSNNFTSLGVSKYIQYYCNYMGITNIVTLGTPIDSSGLSEVYETKDFKTTKSDNIYTVSMDINNYHAWNIINIGGIWTNCDVYADVYFNSKNGSPMGSFLCVPDEITRQTRLFQISNELLGLTPSCTSNNFQANARSMYFIKDYSEEEIQDCVDTLIENINYSKSEAALVQFETESNYNTFCNLFETRLMLFNQTHNNIMPKYSINNYDNVLVFQISNIVFASS